MRVNNESAQALAKWLSPVDGSAVTSLDPSQRYTFSNKPRLVPHTMEPPLPEECASKPNGLWYSPGQDLSNADSSWTWLDYCVHHYGSDIRLGKYLYRIELPSVNRVMRLYTSADILRFTRRYGVHELGWAFVRQVAWEAVWQEYDGLEIIPFQSESTCEPAVHWYRTWDCASGCLWRMPFGELTVELIGVREEDEEDA